MNAEGITIQKWLVFHVFGNIVRRTRLRKSTVLDNTTRDKSIHCPNQPVELELLGAYGNKYHATTSLVHAADKAGIGVHG